MGAVVLDGPGTVEKPAELHLRDLPIPTPEPGQVLIKVSAFGLNRSELHTRMGLAEGVTSPACPASRRPAWWRRPRAESSPPGSR